MAVDFGTVIEQIKTIVTGTTAAVIAGDSASIDKPDHAFEFTDTEGPIAPTSGALRKFWFKRGTDTRGGLAHGAGPHHVALQLTIVVQYPQKIRDLFVLIGKDCDLLRQRLDAPANYGTTSTTGILTIRVLSTSVQSQAPNDFLSLVCQVDFLSTQIEG